MGNRNGSDTVHRGCNTVAESSNDSCTARYSSRNGRGNRTACWPTCATSCKHNAAHMTKSRARNMPADTELLRPRCSSNTDKNTKTNTNAAPMANAVQRVTMVRMLDVPWVPCVLEGHGLQPSTESGYHPAAHPRQDGPSNPAPHCTAATVVFHPTHRAVAGGRHGSGAAVWVSSATQWPRTGRNRHPPGHSPLSGHGVHRGSTPSAHAPAVATVRHTAGSTGYPAQVRVKNKPPNVVAPGTLPCTGDATGGAAGTLTVTFTYAPRAMHSASWPHTSARWGAATDTLRPSAETVAATVTAAAPCSAMVTVEDGNATPSGSEALLASTMVWLAPPVSAMENSGFAVPPAAAAATATGGVDASTTVVTITDDTSGRAAFRHTNDSSAVVPLGACVQRSWFTVVTSRGSLSATPTTRTVPAAVVEACPKVTDTDDDPGTSCASDGSEVWHTMTAGSWGRLSANTATSKPAPSSSASKDGAVGFSRMDGAAVEFPADGAAEYGGDDDGDGDDDDDDDDDDGEGSTSCDADADAVGDGDGVMASDGVWDAVTDAEGDDDAVADGVAVPDAVMDVDRVTVGVNEVDWVTEADAEMDTEADGVME